MASFLLNKDKLEKRGSPYAVLRICNDTQTCVLSIIEHGRIFEPNISIMITVAIAEDIPKLAEIMKQKLELAPEFKVQHIASNGKELIKGLFLNHNVDVVLMDINMPEMNGIEATEFITERWPGIKIIMSTVFDDEQNIFDAIMVGATGYLLKDEPPALIHKAIYEAIEGGAPMSPLIARKAMKLIRSGGPIKKELELEAQLTEREGEILEHLSKGLSYDQIAGNLFISYGTVRKHVENVYRKLKVHSKIEAIERARKGGII